MRILNYHSVIPDDVSDPLLRFGQVRHSVFLRQMKWLKKFASVVPLSAIIEAKKKRMSLPANTVALTFDDGFRNNYHLVFPLLKAFQLPATFFVCDAHLEENRLLWFSRLTIYAIMASAGLSDKNRLRLRNNLFTYFDQQRPATAVRERFGETIPTEIQSFIDSRHVDLILRGLSTSQLREMSESPLIEIGGHSSTHPRLSKYSDSEIIHELQFNKEYLEKLIGKSIRFFAYPEGHYDRKVVEVVRRVGYEAGCAVRVNDLSADPIFEIPRIGIYNDSSILFLAKLFGVPPIKRPSKEMSYSLEAPIAPFTLSPIS